MGILDGKSIVITGSTRGFGLALARALGEAGAAVVVSSRSPAAAEEAAAVLSELGLRAAGQACDVSDLAQVQALFDFALRQFGRLDVWVNNAGIAPPYGPTIHVAPEDFVRTTQTNVLGVYYGSLVAMRHFLTQRRGKLINILGRGERGPQPLQNAYASSKAWVRNFTLALAEEYRDRGVEVLAFNPGMMDTDLLTNVEVIAGYEDRLKSFNTVIQAISQPPEVPAARAVGLASSATDGKTGAVIRELTGGKVVAGFLRQGLRRLLRRPERAVNVQIQSAPPAFPPEARRPD